MNIDIYRVEHKETRIGPFVGYYVLNEQLHDVMQDIQQATNSMAPVNDFSILPSNLPYCMNFGCLSIDQLKDWFVKPLDQELMTAKDFIEGLDKAQFVIAHYQAPKHTTKTGKSGMQVMYNCYDTGLVQRIPLTTLLN